jgi:hypothetical protein
MAGSKQNCSYEELVRIFKDRGWWEEYRIDPNLEYDVGVDVMCVGDLSQGVAPYVTQTFSKNWDLYVATLNGRYHPGIPWPPEEGGLFDGEIIPDFKASGYQLLAINKLLDHARSVQNKAPLYHLDPHDPDLIEKLTIIKNKLKG